jgi:hypothetical protein
VLVSRQPSEASSAPSKLALKRRRAKARRAAHKAALLNTATSAQGSASAVKVEPEPTPKNKKEQDKGKRDGEGKGDPNRTGLKAGEKVKAGGQVRVGGQAKAGGKAGARGNAKATDWVLNHSTPTPGTPRTSNEAIAARMATPRPSQQSGSDEDTDNLSDVGTITASGTNSDRRGSNMSGVKVEMKEEGSLMSSDDASASIDRYAATPSQWPAARHR